MEICPLFLTLQMVNMTAHAYNNVKIGRKPRKINLNLKKPEGFNKVSVKNYLIPPELSSKPRHPPPQTDNIT